MSTAGILKTMLVSIILGGLTVLLTGCASKPDSGTVPQNQVATVQRGDIASYITAIGSLAFSHTQNLAFLINGTVVEVNVREGDTVSKGQVLARLYTTDLQKALDAAESAVKTAEIGVQDAKDAVASVKAAEVDLETVTHAFRKLTYPYDVQTFAFDVPAAMAAINTAQRQLELIKPWLEAGPSSPNYVLAWNLFRQAQDSLMVAQERLQRGQGVDTYLQGRYAVAGDFWALRAAQLAVDKAQSTLDKAKSSFQSGLDKANVALQKAISDRDKAKADLANAVIVAPFDAVVTTVNTYAGDEWRIGRVAFSVAEPNKFKVDMLVNEADVLWVREGVKTTLRVGVAEASVAGTVTRIAPTATVEQGVAKYAVRIEVGSPSSTEARPSRAPGSPAGGSPGSAKPMAVTLRQGLSVTANILKEERKGVVLVPNHAVIHQEGNTFVRVLSGTSVEQRLIKTGLSDRQNTEITEGLTEGDKVLLPSSPGGAATPRAPSGQSTPTGNVTR